METSFLCWVKPFPDFAVPTISTQNYPFPEPFTSHFFFFFSMFFQIWTTLCSGSLPWLLWAQVPGLSDPLRPHSWLMWRQTWSLSTQWAFLAILLRAPQEWEQPITTLVPVKWHYSWFFSPIKQTKLRSSQVLPAWMLVTAVDCKPSSTNSNIIYHIYCITLVPEPQTRSPLC